MNNVPDDQKPTTKIKRVVEYPSRLKTLLGLAVLQETIDKIRADSKSELILPIKYTCILTNNSGLLFDAVIVSHLPLEDYCLMKGYGLFSLERSPELALPNERTVIRQGDL
jgi:hypothetical protein